VGGYPYDFARLWVGVRDPKLTPDPFELLANKSIVALARAIGRDLPNAPRLDALLPKLVIQFAAR
jgi:hypothetical protein